MNTLHILRSEPDQQVCELIRAFTPVEFGQFALFEEDVDYDLLVDLLFSYDRAISWW